MVQRITSLSCHSIQKLVASKGKSEFDLLFRRHRPFRTPPNRTLAPLEHSYPTRLDQIQSHFLHTTNASSKMTYTTRKLGAPNTLDHRIFIEKDGVPISPFHDIPLYANEQQTVLNMIVEIPRWTNAKVEVSRWVSRHSSRAPYS